MGKATLVSTSSSIFTMISSDEFLRVEMQVFKIHPPEDVHFPDGLKFSIVGFLLSDPKSVVLVDCHPPKGSHYHVGDLEQPFEWKGVEHATNLFWKLIEENFGLVNLPGDGK